ncbi:MAG: hypothetical protein AAF962_25035 [Actinomycetota bacterium]
MSTDRSLSVRLAAALAALALILAACGDGDDETEAGASASEADASASASASETAEDADASASASEPAEEPAEEPVEEEAEEPAEEEASEPAEEETEEPAAAISDDPEVQAALDAFAVVYDSSADWEAKAPHLEGAADLQASNDGYQQAGETMGGISLAPTAAVVEGETATITYDVLFGSNAAYNDLTRTITMVDGVWTVSRDDYCDFLSTARTPCAG